MVYKIRFSQQPFSIKSLFGDTDLANAQIGICSDATTTTTALFSPQMLKIIIVYSRLTQLQSKEDHGHPKIAGASRVK